MPRALIIGGSVGGLFAANMLRSIGWDAIVFERNPEELTGRGAGISTHPHVARNMTQTFPSACQSFNYS